MAAILTAAMAAAMPAQSSTMSLPTSAQIREALPLMSPLERLEYDALMRSMAVTRARDSNGDVVLEYLFDKQQSLANDPHRFITACCGRRGGKTVAVAAMMLRAASKNPRRVVLYATLTRGSAKQIIWPTLKSLNAMFALGGVENETDLTLTMPNGAVIVLCGVDKRKEIEKRRGFGFALVVIDECQSIPEHVRSLVDDVIAPALADVPGRLVMIGTPSLLESGYWHECHHNANAVWGHHSWTLFENPTLPGPRDTLEAECARRNVTADDPSIQREWFAKWVRDLLSAVFAFDQGRNTHQGLPIELPAKLWRYVIAVDIGGGVARDNDAISVLAYHPWSRATWLTEEHISPKQDVTGLSLAVVAIRDRLGAGNVGAIVVDTGGIGAKVSEEMSRRHGLSTQAAKKADKWANIELLNAACRRGEFFALKGSQFAREAPKVEKDWDHSTPDRIAIKGHMPDICDSVLYGYVESYAWTSRVPENRPAQGSEEWAKAEAKRLFDKAAADVARAKHANGGEWGVDLQPDDWGGSDAGEWGMG